jgi:hypothetical protein
VTRLLHPYAPPLAAILLVLVTMQVMDWPGCADEIGHASATTAADAGATVPLGPNGSDGAHPDDGMPDCLCHVVFVAAPTLPTAGVPTPAEAAFFPVIDGILSVEESPPDHVPLA